MESRTGYFYGPISGNEFDMITFLRQPQVILKIIGCVFAIVVFGCIATNVNNYSCPYVNSGACGYGTAVGIVAFLGLAAFLVLEAMYDSIASLDNRRYVVISEASFLSVWTFLWFVSFCYMTDTWRRQEQKEKFSISNAQAAIAFSFFSILVFLALTILAVAKYRRGSLEDFLPTSDPPPFGEPYQSQESGSYQGRPEHYQSSAGQAPPRTQNY